MVPRKEGEATNQAKCVGYACQPCERQPPTWHRHSDKSVETQIFIAYLPKQAGGVGQE